MYLSARYAQKSWIKSNRIPYFVCFFATSSIISQILITICYTNIIGIWCDKIIVTISVVFAWKQYRRLNMVLQWSIVDLSVSGDVELLEKHVRMKRRFNRIFITIWIGVSCMVVANYISLISHTTEFIIRLYNYPFTERLLCDTSNDSHLHLYAFSVLYLMEASIVLIGSLFIFVPYTGYGLCTMFVILWRLLKGKTGYRTHFPVQLIAPLI